MNRKPLTLIEALKLARKHVELNGARNASIEFCYNHAKQAVAAKDYEDAHRWLCKAVQYSVGIFHADYTAISGHDVRAEYEAKYGRAAIANR